MCAGVRSEGTYSGDELRNTKSAQQRDVDFTIPGQGETLVGEVVLVPIQIGLREATTTSVDSQAARSHAAHREYT